MLGWVLTKTIFLTPLKDILQLSIEELSPGVDSKRKSSFDANVRPRSLSTTTLQQPEVVSVSSVASFPDLHSVYASQHQQLSNRVIPCATSSVYAFTRKPVVIDVGSTCVRFGLARNERPMSCIALCQNRADTSASILFGESSQRILKNLSSGSSLKSPFQQTAYPSHMTGSRKDVKEIIDWNAMENIWRRVFKGESHVE